MRTVIDVPNEMVEMLDRVGGVEKRPRAALIRDAIGEFLKGKSIPEVESAFGLWKHRKKDGLKYQAGLRAEWGGR